MPIFVVHLFITIIMMVPSLVRKDLAIVQCFKIACSGHGTILSGCLIITNCTKGILSGNKYQTLQTYHYLYYKISVCMQ